MSLVGLVACKARTEEELIAEAEQKMGEQDWLSAILLLQDFLKKHSEGEIADQARFRLAECYTHDGDFAKCREVLDDQIARAGGVDTVRGLNAAILKLDSYIREEKLDTALTEAYKTSETLRTIEPHYKQYLSLVTARILFEGKRFEDAVKIYDGVLLEPAHRPEYHMEAVTRAAIIDLSRQDTDSAIARYRSYLERHPDTPYVTALCVDLAKLLESKEDKAGAEEHYERATAAARKRIEEAVGSEMKSAAKFELAQIQEARGLESEARATYQEVIDEFPMGPARAGAMIRQAESLHREGRTEDSLARLDEVARGYAGSREALYAYQLAQQIQQAAAATTETMTVALPTTDTATSVDPVATP